MQANLVFTNTLDLSQLRVYDVINQTIPPSTFSYSGPGAEYLMGNQRFAYEAEGLPEWLTFNTTNQSFWGIPHSGDQRGNGSFVVLKATDLYTGLSLNGTFLVRVIDRPPEILNPIANQTVQINSNWTLSVGDTFVDKDGDNLTYSYNFVDGELSPWAFALTDSNNEGSWWSFDQTTLTFSGLPVQGDQGVQIITLFADDGYGNSAQSVFSLNISKIAPGAFFPPTTGQTMASFLFGGNWWLILLFVLCVLTFFICCILRLFSHCFYKEKEEKEEEPQASAHVPTETPFTDLVGVPNHIEVNFHNKPYHFKNLSSYKSASSLSPSARSHSDQDESKYDVTSGDHKHKKSSYSATPSKSLDIKQSTNSRLDKRDLLDLVTRGRVFIRYFIDESGTAGRALAYVFYNRETRSIFWCPPDDLIFHPLRSINISDITHIYAGKATPPLQTHLTQDVPAEFCFSIVSLTRSIDLQAGEDTDEKSTQLARDWIEAVLYLKERHTENDQSVNDSRFTPSHGGRHSTTYSSLPVVNESRSTPPTPQTPLPVYSFDLDRSKEVSRSASTSLSDVPPSRYSRRAPAMFTSDANESDEKPVFTIHGSAGMQSRLRLPEDPNDNKHLPLSPPYPSGLGRGDLHPRIHMGHDRPFEPTQLHESDLAESGHVVFRHDPHPGAGPTPSHSVSPTPSPTPPEYTPRRPIEDEILQDGLDLSVVSEATPSRVEQGSATPSEIQPGSRSARSRSIGQPLFTVQVPNPETPKGLKYSSLFSSFSKSPSVKSTLSPTEEKEESGIEMTRPGIYIHSAHSVPGEDHEQQLQQQQPQKQQPQKQQQKNFNEIKRSIPALSSSHDTDSNKNNKNKQDRSSTSPSPSSTEEPGLLFELQRRPGSQPLPFTSSNKPSPQEEGKPKQSFPPEFNLTSSSTLSFSNVSGHSDEQKALSRGASGDGGADRGRGVEHGSRDGHHGGGGDDDDIVLSRSEERVASYMERKNEGKGLRPGSVGDHQDDEDDIILSPTEKRMASHMERGRGRVGPGGGDDEEDIVLSRSEKRIASFMERKGKNQNQPVTPEVRSPLNYQPLSGSSGGSGGSGGIPERSDSLSSQGLRHSVAEEDDLVLPDSLDDDDRPPALQKSESPTQSKSDVLEF